MITIPGFIISIGRKPRAPHVVITKKWSHDHIWIRSIAYYMQNGAEGVQIDPFGGRGGRRR